MEGKTIFPNKYSFMEANRVFLHFKKKKSKLYESILLNGKNEKREKIYTSNISSKLGIQLKTFTVYILT